MQMPDDDRRALAQRLLARAANERSFAAELPHGKLRRACTALADDLEAAVRLFDVEPEAAPSIPAAEAPAVETAEDRMDPTDAAASRAAGEA